MEASYSLNLNVSVLPSKVAVGVFNGENPSLCGATAAEKVFIHSPHYKLSTSGNRLSGSATEVKDITFLNINQPVRALDAGRLRNSDERDSIVVGTPYNLLAYDVHNNSDVFYREVPDGVRAMAIGKLGSYPEPLVLAGGNCAIQGFDSTGNDPFWTVTGDNVASLALMDFDGDGMNELVVGSEDYQIRAFKQDEILAEIMETDSVINLTHLSESQFGYGLANGTVGIYDRNQRWWRIKSKNQVTCLRGFDLDGDGVPELISGWSNGKIDARNARTGEVIFKDHLKSPIAGINVADYRLDGKPQLICVSTTGQVKGFSTFAASGRDPGTGGVTGLLGAVNLEQETIRELSQSKQQLLLELKNYKLSRSAQEQPNAVNNDAAGVIPANTQLQTGLALNLGSGSTKPHVELALATTNKTALRTILVFAEGVFEGESLIVHPVSSTPSGAAYGLEPKTSLRVPLYPPRDAHIDLHIKALVGQPKSINFHVFELTRQVPRFAMYAPWPLATSDEGRNWVKIREPKGTVKFKVAERINRIAMWMNQNFLLAEDIEVPDGATDLARSFLALRTCELLETGIRECELMTFRMDSFGNCTLETDDIDFAGDFIQSVAVYLNLSELQVLADFPNENAKVEKLLQQAEEMHSVGLRLNAQMADHSGVIKSLIVRAEDARLLGHWDSMRKWYIELMGLNRELMAGHKVRLNHHQELTSCLKQLNQVVQKAAKLRVGKYKTDVVNGCRQAIKTSNLSALVKVISTGEL